MTRDPSSRTSSPGNVTACIIALALTASAVPARGQVNVEPFRRQVSEGKLATKINGSLTAYEGNTEGVVLGANGLTGARQRPHFGFLTASGKYARLGQATTIAKTFAHARYNYEFSRSLIGELFLQAETDRFRRLALRSLLGTGPRFEWDKKTYNLFYGTAYLLEYTERNDPQLGTAGANFPDGVFHRWGNYGGSTWQVDAATELHAVIYYQPRFVALSDYRLLLQSGVSFTINQIVESGVSVGYAYESRVPAGVERGDLTITNTLGVRF